MHCFRFDFEKALDVILHLARSVFNFDGKNKNTVTSTFETKPTKFWLDLAQQQQISPPIIRGVADEGGGRGPNMPVYVPNRQSSRQKFFSC